MLGPCHEEVSTLIQTKKDRSHDEHYNSRPVSTLVFSFSKVALLREGICFGKIFLNKIESNKCGNAQKSQTNE